MRTAQPMSRDHCIPTRISCRAASGPGLPTIPFKWKLREGDQVEVLQNGRPIARLKVTRVSGARVEAQIADKTGFIELGDEVRLTEDSTNQADDTAEDKEQ